ncbi:MAG TPA: S8 family serine peptidase [Gaiellaceae bacterium]|nr:S8 family serine peptidase [Gaiellaceae bacterium]
MRTRVLLTGALLLALSAVLFTAAAAARSDGRAAKAGNARIDLATYDAKRWIVQLKAKPLARYPGAKRAISFAGIARPKIDLKATVNRRYVSRLARVQRGFAARLRTAVRGVRIERTFRVTLNGMAVRMTKAQAAKVRRMKGVRAVTPDVPYRLNMYATPQQIGAPALWAQLGGQENAGRGVKVAIIDSGVYVTKDAAGNYAGNPCFNDAGYTMPRGYPKGDTRFTNAKVIAARAYFRPTDPPAAGNDTPIQGPGGSPHGTHVGGTVACNANTPTGLGSLTISGVAPAAYLMNYRIFYPSTSSDPFENGNGWTVEIVQAIEDAVKDGADVLSNSWGSSHQNTLDWPDPMVVAAESAVDAGVVGVWAQGNSGPATATGNLPSASDKVISVGAVTKYETLIQSSVNVIGRADLQNLDTGPASFGPSMVDKRIGPANYVPAEAAPNNGAIPSEGCGDYPAGSLTGKIALIARGTCEFGLKVFKAQQAGAIGALVYNSVAGGDALQAMGGGVFGPQVTIPSVFMRRSNGLAMVAHYNANPAAAQAEFFYNPHGGPNPGDVIAGFSSRGPTQDKDIKPDVVAPGVDVFSGGYATGPFPTPFTGFGSASGTSMATPHVAGAVALLLQKHPWWTPAMIKSALMSTANEDVYTTTARTTRVSVLAQGAGRIDLTKAPDPGLIFNQPSVSGREMSAGQSKTFKVRARNISGQSDTWTVSTTETGAAAHTDKFSITTDKSSLALKRHRSGSINVTVASVGDAPAANYEGSVVLVSEATGKRLHIPVWFRILPAVQKDVLLLDDDGSSAAGLTDYKATYTGVLDSLGLTYDYKDMGVPPFTVGAKFGVLDLHKYRAVVLFTGNNADFANVSGFFGEDHDALAEWLDSGGRLWAVGQNFALAEDSGTYHSRLDRGRITSGYLGLAYEAADAYGGAAAPHTANGVGPFAGMTLGLNQTSIDAYSPIRDTDTYAAQHTTKPLFQTPAGTGISYSRTSDPTLEEERQEYLYRAISMGFGVEGLASGATPAQLGDRTFDWLLDRIDVGLASASIGRGKRSTLRASASSSVGAAITKYRWDFGDRSRWVTTGGPTVTHKFRRSGTFDVRIEATDSLGHTSVGHAVVRVRGGSDDDDDDD